MHILISAITAISMRPQAKRCFEKCSKRFPSHSEIRLKAEENFIRKTSNILVSAAIAAIACVERSEP